MSYLSNYKNDLLGNILFPICLLACMFSCKPQEEGKLEDEQRPNIIFIMSDDHAYQAISAYGGRLADVAPTPNIDRIADDGMLFNRCLVTNSICGPSRACIRARYREPPDSPRCCSL